MTFFPLPEFLEAHTSKYKYRILLFPHFNAEGSIIPYEGFCASIFLFVCLLIYLGDGSTSVPGGQLHLKISPCAPNAFLFIGTHTQIVFVVAQDSSVCVDVHRLPHQLLSNSTVSNSLHNKAAGDLLHTPLFAQRLAYPHRQFPRSRMARPMSHDGNNPNPSSSLLSTYHAGGPWHVSLTHSHLLTTPDC